MIKVQVRPNEPLEAALRRFKRQCNYAGIFRLAKKYAFHEKRSDKNRREGRERIRNIQRAQRKQQRSMRRTKRRKSKIKGGRNDEATMDDVKNETPVAPPKPPVMTPGLISTPVAPGTSAPEPTAAADS